MRNMLHMQNRMTHRTDYHEIVSIVIFSIFINMMHSQNLRYFIIATFFTFIHESFSKHFFSDSRKFRLPNRSSIFSYAFFRTKLSLMCCMSNKNFFAMMAFIFLLPFHFLRIVIASSATIFGVICAGRNMRKFFITNATSSNYFCDISKFVFASPRTIFERIQSVFRHVAFFATSQTFYVRSFHYASS